MADVARLSLACHCGGTLTGHIRPASAAGALTGAWQRIHHGPAHGPATLQQAATARRRQRRGDLDQLAEAFHG